MRHLADEKDHSQGREAKKRYPERTLLRAHLIRSQPQRVMTIHPRKVKGKGRKETFTGNPVSDGIHSHRTPARVVAPGRDKFESL